MSTNATKMLKNNKLKRLKKQMEQRRKIQLKKANETEDKIIKHLEKQLKLNKRKSKTTPKSFTSDGLDYLLDFCDTESRKNLVETEKQLVEADCESEFEEDFAIAATSLKYQKNSDDRSDMTVSKNTKKKINNHLEDYNTDDSSNKVHEKMSDENNEDQQSTKKRKIKTNSNKQLKKTKNDVSPEKNIYNLKEKKNSMKLLASKVQNNVKENDKKSEMYNDVSNEENVGWEDIYGRKRDKDGNTIPDRMDKYIPPAARHTDLKINSTTNDKLTKLKKQLKGLLNRLAEYNMHTIALQVDELYMANSRNDMNEVLYNLMVEALVLPVLTPDRLVTEHMMLICILHANVGIEVGAHFLLKLIKKLDKMLQDQHEVENKEVDNVLLMVSHLYNFKVYGSQLLYQILENLSNKFTEKEVELILLILKTVGFVLRKDNPLALKELIIKLQQKAVNMVSENSRIRFMLDVLLAIKNNNVTKIPQYDPSHVEHLKKLMKTIIRKGNTVTQLNVSLNDLLFANERGKWWIVGSAWSGGLDEKKDNNNTNESNTIFSKKLLDLARKQRMNTDIRKNIFCILMSAEDYLDAFEKLHHLGLKNQQEREVIYVIIDCCLQEKKFNPYYAVLAEKFCNFDRKYQMTIQYTLWDKLKILQSYNSKQLANLAQFLTHLFLEKGLPLSVLKVIEFGELDKPIVRLLRQIMLGILLHENTDACVQVFERISMSSQLHMFREGLRLFINHFVVKIAKEDVLPTQQVAKLKETALLMDKILMSHGTSNVF
ncbi:nucleolar MIF4G domain-containing protein 1 [Orussus abietinus]|uniref:nucleolar MIF4G domain-containing protein 1 n=1 Tax=Orussus abietinus TaxID=222816 RepID=UPI000626A43E|nr:nucleolar MIF4G domain-containing protein 1 [Orussus abietinus]